MAEVTFEQALEIMDLEPDATPTEVDARFHELASQTHPDHGGSAESFAAVVAARDRLKEQAKGGDLVRLGRGASEVVTTPSSELVAIERERDASRERREHSEQVARGLVRAEVSRLTRSRRRASFLAWLGGGAGALTLALRYTDSTAEGYVGFPWIAPVLIFSIGLGVACAIGSFAVSDQISRIEQAIEDAAETMSSRAAFLDLIYEIVDYGQMDDIGLWSTSELIDGVAWWSRVHARVTTPRWDREGSVPRIVRIALLPFTGLRRIARWSLSGRFDPTPSLADLAAVIGPDGFTRLLIAKGEETRLLVAEEDIDDGRLLVMHRLVIEPALRAGSVPSPA